MDAQIVSLETLGGGAAVERFNYELQRVLDNIGDINTKPTAARKVQLTITIAPNEERTGAAVLINVKSTLASIKSEATHFYLENHGNTIVATEYNPKQERLFAKEVARS